jgi:HAD superfamily hydrolase (TIGR01549 family)
MIRAVLFDVGGPLNMEIEHEQLVDADMRAAARVYGVDATDAQYEAAVAAAVHSYAPDAHQAIVWRLAGGDTKLARLVYMEFSARAQGRQIPFDLRPGMPELLAWLHKRELRLGLAANQPHETLAILDGLGIGRYFTHLEVSGTHGFRKPDVRLFLRACEDLGVSPSEAVMVGDRIDNDIAPARWVGMRTVLFRTGRHIDQQPRSAVEVPDAEVTSTEQLRAVLDQMIKFRDG